MKQRFSLKCALIAGALLVCGWTNSAYAQTTSTDLLSGAQFNEEQAEVSKPKSKWLDEQPKHIGLMWNCGADIVSNYVWRGLYVGGLGIQPDFMVGYGGLFLDMWWNIGATDWTFKSKNTPINCALNPEVDMTLGFSRWGLTVMFMHMYYFDKYVDDNGMKQMGNHSKYFDFANHGPGEGGITQEWRIKYKVSSKLPLTIMWCTRTWGRDGYFVDADGNQVATRAEMEATGGHLKRAYSSYFEVSYDFKLPYDITMSAAVGFTPWKSMYTGFQGDFAVNYANIKLTRSWDLSKHCYMIAFADLMANPYDMALQANGKAGVNGNRPILWNVGCSFYLK